MARYHHMTPQPPSRPAGAQQQKGPSGCLIAVIVAGALGALLCIAGAVLVGAAAQSPEGRRAVSMMSKGVSAAAKAMSAPGAKEVRAAGCPEAMVMDTNELAGFFGELFDGGVGPKRALSALVLCQGSFGLPTCDDVAAAYRAAPGVKAGPFTVVVKRKGSQENECEHDY